MRITRASTIGENYARCIETSKRVRWDIDRDVIRGRTFDFSKKFLPDGLSKTSRLVFLDPKSKTLLSQIQGRTYANFIGLLERFISAKMLELSRDYWLGDQSALEALVRFTDEELKHQELFRRIDAMIAQEMPGGYRFMPHPNDVANAVLARRTWAVLALTCHIEMFTQTHCRQSIALDPELSELFKDVFLFHCKEESQHAILNELEWRRENAKLTTEERDAAVNDLIILVFALDGVLQMQAGADADYFVRVCASSFDTAQLEAIHEALLAAYRWQYIGSGMQNERFQQVLGALVNDAQMERIGECLTSILN